MSDKTTIEWTDTTWNPTTGCDQVSPGCDNCYALGMAKRLKAMDQPDYQNDGDPKTSGPGFGITVHTHRLDMPLRWKKPRRVFVNSMSDLFHEAVPDNYIARVFAVMAEARQHTFQVLTKRHGRMRSLVGRPDFRGMVADEAAGIPDWPNARRLYEDPWDWPLPNVWLGVSVENQKWADIRIPALLDTPATVRFLSCEPLLGPVDLTAFLPARPGQFCERHWSWLCQANQGDCIHDRIDWVIVGGESGRGARPMHPDWARSLRDQCTAAGVAYHFKQWGEWHPRYPVHSERFNGAHNDETGTWRVGKKTAGRELDGRTWDEYPEAVS